MWVEEQEHVLAIIGGVFLSKREWDGCLEVGRMLRGGEIKPTMHIMNTGT